MHIPKNIKALLTLFVLLSQPAFAQIKNDKAYKVEFNINSFSYSEVMPVIETFAGVIPVARIGRETSFSSKPEQGRQAITHNRANIRVSWDHWFIQLASRYDYDIQFTPDAAQLFFLERNQRPVNKDKYLLKFSANHVKANGFGLGYQWQFKQLDMNVVANYWHVQNMQNGDINGIFHVEDDGEHFEVTGDIDYKYFQDALLDRNNCSQSDPPVPGCHGAWKQDGDGYSIDMQLAYQINKNWRFEASVWDLFNQFTYKQLGITQGQLDTQNEVFNPDGSFSIKPSFKGQFSDGKYKQSIPTQTNLRLSADYAIPVWAELYTVEDSYFPSLGVGGDYFNTRFELGYQAKSNALIVRAKHAYFNVSVASETINFQQAGTIIIDFSLNYAW
ncbi:hypothetical protein [Catenovulum adriaticum]|uniref:DUF5723 domain-containing protein n=1 Tax=Catenovulum adriaticum TaxID=2984846 RepID=A0ABY7AIR0_9ALTE|nr:hypothetical protein [Catenovulum sp. TS8]WAJ69404.1 hypothetical protein OLW01_09455 [Catenovulum sp. TS8]